MGYLHVDAGSLRVAGLFGVCSPIPCLLSAPSIRILDYLEGMLVVLERLNMVFSHKLTCGYVEQDFASLTQLQVVILVFFLQEQSIGNL